MRCKKLADLQRDIETLAGEWKLSPEHELTYKERDTGGGTRATTLAPMRKCDAVAFQRLPRTVSKEAEFKAQIVAVEPDALVVSVTVDEDQKRKTTGLVKLAGKWELDDKNRITFTVGTRATIQGPGKERGPSVLTFEGAWEVNEHHEVVYSFTTKSVVEGAGKKRHRVTRVTQGLVFKGEWDVSDENKLTYLIGIDSDSAFRFRGTFESSHILAKEGEIRYQVGLEYKTSRGAKKRLTQTIVLFGKGSFRTILRFHLRSNTRTAEGPRSGLARTLT
ncbi:MAG TPA: hypothetical protein PKI45_02940 [Candidatus Omnitrophota bacterium]|nr:hypothetical protein [Candidatus Omnitrophota bacterium]